MTRGRGGDGGYHRNVTRTVRGLGQTHRLLDAGGSVPGEADHRPIRGVEAGRGRVWFSRGHGAWPQVGATAEVTVTLRLHRHCSIVVVVVLLSLFPHPSLLALATAVAVVGVAVAALAAAPAEVLILQPGLGARGPGARGDARAGGHPVMIPRVSAHLVTLARVLASRAQQQVHPGRALSRKSKLERVIMFISFRDVSLMFIFDVLVHRDVRPIIPYQRVIRIWHEIIFIPVYFLISPLTALTLSSFPGARGDLK